MSTDPDWPTLAWIEREYIEARLNHFGGNKTVAAKSLGICLKTLHNRLNEYNKAGVPLRIAKSVKAPKVSVRQRKWLAREAAVQNEARKRVCALINQPMASWQEMRL